MQRIFQAWPVIYWWYSCLSICQYCNAGAVADMLVARAFLFNISLIVFTFLIAKMAKAIAS